MRKMLLLIVGLILITGGCGPEPEVQSCFRLLSDIRIEDLRPTRYTPGAELALTVACDSRYAGRGVIHIVGHGGGAEVATLLTPVEAPLGTFQRSIAFATGRLQIPLIMRMTTTLDQPALSITVTCDSVLVDGAMMAWLSPEALAMFRQDGASGAADVQHASYRYVTIPRAR